MRLRRDLFWPAAVAVAAGAIAFVLVGRIMATKEVVVAARDLAPMSSIADTSVKIVSMPYLSVHSKAYTRIRDTVGKRVLGPLSAGQQITVDNLSDPGQGLRQWTASGRVVMFVPMPLTRWLGGAIHPGDSIDLIFCANQQKTGVNLSRTVLAGVIVAGTMGAQQQRWDQSSSEPVGLSLVVPTHEAEMLAFCLENGSLYACLSNPNVVRTGTGVTIETVVGNSFDEMSDR